MVIELPPISTLQPYRPESISVRFNIVMENHPIPGRQGPATCGSIEGIFSLHSRWRSAYCYTSRLVEQLVSSMLNLDRLLGDHIYTAESHYSTVLNTTRSHSAAVE